MSNSKSLSLAKKAKNDEFYTQLSDISDELLHYKHHFKDKVVFCNCDDPFESNFFKYFVLSFNHLGLKQLITTSYSKTNAYKTVINRVNNIMNDVKDVFKFSENTIENLSGDGDFRSEECIKLLDESDIVVTNPPFSLFREYLSTLVKHDKKFLIIGNCNAVVCKEIFPLLKENKIWLGYKYGSMSFMVPDDYKPKKGGYWQDSSGQKWQKMGNICWYTNLDIKKIHEPFLFGKEYVLEEYPQYDNYDAIDVGRLSDIPSDYCGIMGVPITFMDKYNPDQFEILGASQRGCHDDITELKQYDDYKEMRQDGTETGSSGSKTNGNPNIARNDGKHNYFINSNGHIVQSTYSRIFIRNRYPKKLMEVL